MPPGRPVNPRFRTTSAGAIPSGNRIRYPFDIRTANARKRVSRRLRDPMAPAPRKSVPPAHDGSSAQCIAERFTLGLHLDEGDLNGAVRHVWMNEPNQHGTT